MDAWVLGEAEEGCTLQLKIVNRDGLCHLGVVQLYFRGQHVLHLRLPVGSVDKRFVLKKGVARRIVLHDLVLRYKGLHAIDGQPVHIKHRLQWDLTKRSIQHLRQLQLFLHCENDRLVVFARLVLDGTRGCKAIQTLACSQNERLMYVNSVPYYDRPVAVHSSDRVPLNAALGAPD